MSRLERRVFLRSLTIGALLTFVVLIAGAFGLLDSLEYWLYDQRAIYCQLAEPAPTSQFVHIDIDDASLAALGRWPWPRGELASMLDEIHLARPSAVGLDILFADPQDDRLVQDRDGNLRTEKDDQQLVSALRDCGNTILAASFKLESTQAADLSAPQHALDLLVANLELTQDQFAHQLQVLGSPVPAGKALEDQYLKLLRRAMKTRVNAELDKEPATQADLAHRLLPTTDPRDLKLPLNQLLAEEYSTALSERALLRFGAPLQTLAIAPARGNLDVIPLAKFTNVAAECAFANYDIFDNATVRAIPLFVEYNHRLFPQMGLAIACVMLGADPAAARFEGSTVIIPTRKATVTIPAYAYHSKTIGREVSLITAVPWFGTRDWETMYDWPDHRTSAAHISIASIWDICSLLETIKSNSATIDEAISHILSDDRADKLGLDPDLAKKYAAALPDPLDTASREAMATKALKSLDDSHWLDQYAQIADKDLKPDERLQKTLLYDAVDALKNTVAKNHQLHIDVEDKRKWLASQIAGKGVLIGHTATGDQDQVSTSLHLHCPGVVVHGVIINAVLNNYWWRKLPDWVNILLTIVLGMTAAALQGKFHPLRACFFVFALLFGYALINGYILFDWHKWIVGLAGPSVAMIVVWGGTTLDRVLVERGERNRVAIENAVISKEMDLARQVQIALIPTRAPKIVGLEAEGWALTASVTGGDCYDLWQLKDGRLAILLADASGHGLAPAMIVSQVRTLARSLCEFETHPHGLLARINRRLADDLESTRFVTAFLGFLSPGGKLEWASAGHGPMFWNPGAKSEMLPLDSTGLPLGVMPECFMEDPQPPLNLGENGYLIVFSDGLFEAHAPDGSMFGVERVKEILEETRGQPCAPILDALRSAVQKFQQKIEPDDDQTIVVIRRVVVTAAG